MGAAKAASIFMGKIMSNSKDKFYEPSRKQCKEMRDTLRDILENTGHDVHASDTVGTRLFIRKPRKRKGEYTEFEILFR